MSSILCSSCKSMLPAYSRFCKHCGTIIDGPPNTDPMRRIPVVRTFKASNAASMSAHQIQVSTEQVRRRWEGNASIVVDPPAGGELPGERRFEPETGRLPITGNRVRLPEHVLRQKKLLPVADLPVATLPKVAALQPVQRSGLRPPARPGQVFPSTQPQQRLGAPQLSPSLAPQRPHAVQLRKIQPQELLSQHPLMPTEQQVSDQLTLQNLVGLSPSVPRLEVQPMYPIALMRREPFSLPTSLQISHVGTVTKRVIISESIIVVLLIIGLIVGLVLTFKYVLPVRPLSPYKPTLTLIGLALPGSVVTLHGRNFAAGSSVKFSIDDAPLAQIYKLSTVRISYSTHMPTEKAVPASGDSGTIVRSDGTFDKTFTIPLQWKPGSAHSIQAYAQSAQTAMSVRLDFVVSAAQVPALTPLPTATAVKPTPEGPLTPTASSSPTAHPTLVPTLTPALTPVEASCISVTPRRLSFRSLAGQEGGAQVVTISNCGNAGNWSSSVSTDKGGDWLKVSARSGKLNGGASQRLSVASAALKAGTYTGRITFSSSTNAVSVNVSLVVEARPFCIRTSTHALSFTGDPASQIVTLTGCGGWGRWSASTDDGSKRDVTVSASNLAAAPGTYTGRITFTSDSDSISIRITLTVLAPQASPQALTFDTGQSILWQCDTLRITLPRLEP